MKITDYLNSVGILWFPILLEVTPEGKKVLKYTFEYMPNPQDFDTLSRDTIIYRQSLLPKCNHIAIDTREVYHIDFDTKDFEEIRNGICNLAPYFLSTSKQLPHVFVKPKNPVDKMRVQTIYEGIELLTGQWSYATKDTIVHNHEKDFQLVDVEHMSRKEEMSTYDNHTFYDGHKPENVNKILDLIDIKYIDNFDSWKVIGASLYNSGYDFEVFDLFSRKGSKYGGTRKLWDSFSKKQWQKIGFGTVCYYAKISNPEKWYECFNLITENQKTELDNFLESGHFTHHVVAKLFYEKYSDKLAYCDKTWYKLTEGGIFQKLNSDSTIIISKTIKDYIQSFLLNAIKNEKDSDKKKILWKANSQIENNGFKKSCVEEASGEFLDRNLLEKLDTNTKLIGFRNGIFDLENCTFRIGNVEDRVSMTTNINYNPEIDQEKQQFLENLFDSYFEKPETAYFFKKHLGSLLEGGNNEEKTYFWVGNGRNGKGTTDHLLRETLGNYYCEFSNDYFTIADKDSGRAKPEVIRLRNKRITMTHEPEGSVKYISSKFKTLCGGDLISGRDLYNSTFVSFKPVLKPIVQTNHLPQFTDIDDGLLQRLIVIRFPYKYLDPNNYDPENKYHRKIDFDLKNKLKNMNQDFFHFLVKYYKLYKSEGLGMCDNVKHEINIYRKDIDSVKTFCEEALIKTDNDKDRVSTADLLYKHNAWASTKLDKNRFAGRLTTIGFVLKQRVVQGSGKIMCIAGYKYNQDFINEQEQEMKFVDI